MGLPPDFLSCISQDIIGKCNFVSSLDKSPLCVSESSLSIEEIFLLIMIFLEDSTLLSPLPLGFEKPEVCIEAGRPQQKRYV